MDQTRPSSGEVFRQARSRHVPKPQAAPFIRGKASTRGIMANVLLALAPAVVGSWLFFGLRAWLYYVVAVSTALLCDALAQLLRRREIAGLDLSAAVTGVLLAMSLPPTAPLWFAAAGTAFGILVAKELFGGIGFNFLNPALAGRAALWVAFPAQMMQNALPAPPFGNSLTVDAVAAATPLTVLKTGAPLTRQSILHCFLGIVPGKLGETSALLLLLGAAWLFARGIIRLRIPLAMLGTMALMAFTLGGPGTLFSGGANVVLGHLFGGATLLGAFFMATDYSTSPSLSAAQWVYGVLCGLIVMLFRLYGPWAGGITFSLLLANCLVPLLNRIIRPRALGQKRQTSAKQYAPAQTSSTKSLLY